MSSDLDGRAPFTWWDVQPSSSLIQCPDCDKSIRIQISVQVGIRDDPENGQELHAHAVPDVQPVWDHVLERHGPGRDELWGTS